MQVVVSAAVTIFGSIEIWKMLPAWSNRTRIDVTDTRRTTNTGDQLEWKRRTVITTTTRRWKKS